MFIFIFVVQSLSRAWLLATPQTAAQQVSLSFTISWSLLKLISIQSVMPSNHLVLCHPLLLPPLIFPSIRVFSNGSALHIRCPKYWNFSFSISPFNEYLGLISFRMDWLDLLAVQRTLKSLLQHHSSKASIFWHSAFFIVQLSHPYMTTVKIISLSRCTFVRKVISLLLNMLSSFVIAFLPRSKGLLISWLQSPSAVILEPKKIKSDTVSIGSPSIWHEVMGLDTMWSSFFECWTLSQLFHSPLSSSSTSSNFLPLIWCRIPERVVYFYYLQFPFSDSSIHSGQTFMPITYLKMFLSRPSMISAVLYARIISHSFSLINQQHLT